MKHKRDICIDLFHLSVCENCVIKLASISRYNIVTSIVYEFKVKTLKNQKYIQING